MPKKVLVALPAALLEKIDYIAALESRTRSDLIRETLRQYVDRFDLKQATLRRLNKTEMEHDLEKRHLELQIIKSDIAAYQEASNPTG